MSQEVKFEREEYGQKQLQRKEADKYDIQIRNLGTSENYRTKYGGGVPLPLL